MKNLLLITVILLATFSINGCSSEDNKTLNSDIKSEVVSNERATNNDANKVINDFTNELINSPNNKNTIDGLPKWAKELGLVEPQNMILDQENSSMTSSTNKHEAINSVTLVYKADYDTAMKEAERIAKNAHVSLNKEFQMAQELQSNLPDTLKVEGGLDTIKGAIYTNYEISTMQDVEYPITISVQEDGELTISTYNQKQLSKQEE